MTTPHSWHRLAREHDGVLTCCSDDGTWLAYAGRWVVCDSAHQATATAVAWRAARDLDGELEALTEGDD